MAQFCIVARGEWIEVQRIGIQTALDAVLGVFEVAEDDTNRMRLLHGRGQCNAESLSRSCFKGYGSFMRCSAVADEPHRAPIRPFVKFNGLSIQVKGKVRESRIDGLGDLPVKFDQSSRRNLN